MTQDARNTPDAAIALGNPYTELATPSSRFWANIIDSLVLLIPTGAIMLSLWSGDSGDVISGLLVNALTIAYTGTSLMLWGRTVGKRALRIRVVSTAPDGKLTAGQAWLRAVAFSLPMLLSLVGLDDIIVTVLDALDCAWLLWDKPNRQAVHDKIARTKVVRDA